MSKIYGIINFSGQPVEQIHLDKMVTSMQDPMPDGQDLHIKNNVGLDHVLMQVSSESVYEKQPLQYKNWTIVLDGRLFNRDVLVNKLNISSANYTNIPDSVLVVRAFEKWGNSCTKHLVGEYAFVIWDKKAKNVFCAKDRFGNRPLFYYWDKQRFCFSSELRSLVELPFVKTNTNDSFLFKTIVRPFNIQKDETSFQNIYSVTKAHTLRVSKDKKRLKSFWRPTYKSTIRLKPDKDYISFFQETVQKQLIVG